jgi:hypothetical protein
MLESLEPAIDPNNRIAFLLDWEITMKCNLDCSYCRVGLHGGHDNNSRHPPKEECIKALAFIFEYVDQYMSHKPKGLRYVILNVYGGESLHHPDIVDILSQIRSRYQPYQDRWHLTVTTTTNAILPKKKLAKIIPYIDEFTVSSHVECTAKQKQQFKENLLTIRDANKRLKCVVLMHDDPVLFQESQEFMTWLESNHIKYLPRQLDAARDRGPQSTGKPRSYNKQQVVWFNSLYQSKTYGQAADIDPDQHQTVNLTDVGRACCGGRQTCQNQNYKERQYYVFDNTFTDWYCSVNRFFLFVKQRTNEVYVSKDCKMRFDGTVGPIGTLADADAIIAELKTQLASENPPVMQCKKTRCLCGLCAPKAKNLATYQSIIKKYQT